MSIHIGQTEDRIHSVILKGYFDGTQPMQTRDNQTQTNFPFLLKQTRNPSWSNPMQTKYRTITEDGIHSVILKGFFYSNQCKTRENQSLNLYLLKKQTQ